MQLSWDYIIVDKPCHNIRSFTITAKKKKSIVIATDAWPKTIDSNTWILNSWAPFCYLTPIVPNWLGRQLRLVEHFRRGPQPANLAVGVSIQKQITQYGKQKSTMKYTTSNIKYTRRYPWTDDMPCSPSQPMCFQNTKHYDGAPTSCAAHTLSDPF